MTGPVPVLLLTRPRARSEDFAAMCRARFGNGVRVLVSPVLTIRPRAVAPDLDGVAGLILTSAHGVAALDGREDVAGLTAYTVGAHTAAAARAAGLNPVAAEGDAESLVRLILDARPEGRLLHLRGAEARGDVAARLRSGGLNADEAVVYDQVETPLTPEARAALAGADPVILPVFSPRSARLLGKAARDAAAPLSLAALSPAVAGAWNGPVPQRLAVAERPDAAHMLEVICNLFDAARA